MNVMILEQEEEEMIVEAAAAHVRARARKFQQKESKALFPSGFHAQLSIAKSPKAPKNP